MKTVRAYRAQAARPDKPVEQVTIEIDDEIPASGVAFEEQARTLASVLWETLPGGTIDALIAEMLKRRASKYRVPFGNPS